METNQTPEGQARSLYMELGLTQEQIAQIVGVSQKTISLWMNEGNWKTLKEYAARSPAVLIELMNQELVALSNTISARGPDKRFPTLEEAETRRKVIFSINNLKSHQGISANIEAMMNFINYVLEYSFDDGKLVHKYADKYIQGIVKSQKKVPGVPYKPDILAEPDL